MAKYKLKLNLSDGTIVTTNNSIDIPDDSNLVHKTGDENIAGTKTFSMTDYGDVYYSDINGEGLVARVNTGGGDIKTTITCNQVTTSCLRISSWGSTTSNNSWEIAPDDGDDFQIYKSLDANTGYSYSFPDNSGTFALTSDFETETSKYQSTSVVVGNAITNINGRVFQNYTATLVTSGGYTFYQILKNGNNPTEDEAKEYMRYMTGSTFLPKYNYDFPKQTIFTFADRSTWKPQYSSNDGLRLYRLTTALALASDLPQVIDLRGV